MTKLVRNKIPELYPEYKYRQAKDVSEFLRLLGEKLLEESEEVLHAKELSEDYWFEIADVMEVIMAICGNGNKSLKELQRYCEVKRIKIGGLVAFLYAYPFPKSEWRQRVDEAFEGMNVN